MDKQQILNVFLTKESFNQYSRKLREEKAAQYGMTLEEWDDAVLNGKVINNNSGSLK